MFSKKHEQNAFSGDERTVIDSNPVNGGAESFDDDQAAFDERVGIAQHDGGLSRDEAEKLARDELPDLPSFLDRRRHHQG